MAAKKGKTGNSPALILVQERRIDHTVVEFEHDDSIRDFGAEAARALGCDPAQVFKTLVWQVDGSACLAVAPVTTQVSGKRLATALGGRRAVLAEQADAERISGSVVGAISPLGLRQQVPVVLDVSAVDHPRIYVSAGRRGVELGLRPADLAAITAATIAPITTGPIGT